MKGIPFSVGNFLRAAIARVRRIYLIRGFAAVGIVWILGIVAVMAVDSRIVIFDDRIRWAMTAGAWLFALVTAMLAIVLPLRRRLDFRRMAAILDRRHPEQEERLSTLVELSESDFAKAGFSTSLFALVGNLAEDDVGKLDLVREFPVVGAWRRFGVFALMALALALGSAISPNLVGRLFVRAVAPWSDIGNLFSDEIVVTPGDITILSGSVIRIEAKRNEENSTVHLQSSPSPFSIRLSRKTPHGWSDETTETMAGGVYETTADLNERVWRYRVTAGHAVTRYYYVRVSQMPRYDLFTATVDYPAYTRMQPLVLSNADVAAITAIDGSHVKFDVKVSDPGTLVDFTIAKRPIFEYTMVSNRTASWSLDLVNEDGFRAEKGRGQLASFIDQPPTVLIEKPTGTLRLPPHAKIPVEITASDDIGIADAYFRVSIDNEPWERHYGSKISLSSEPLNRSTAQPLNPTFLRTVADVDLSVCDLIFAKNVRFDIVVSDACPPELGGPHSATSTPFTVQFAADEASYEMQELKHEVDEARRDIAEARKRLNDAQSLARQVRDELRRDQKPSAATEERSERLAHELDEAESRISELRDEFLSDERFAPLARPLDRILEETLKPALEEVESSQFRDRDERADAVSDAMPEMEKAVQELDDFSKRLTERANKVDAFEKAKDLAARQDALAKSAEELTREHPLDTAKLEAWKRLEEAAMRKADELAREDPDSDISEAKRKMETAAREMARLKDELEAAAAESNRLAKAAADQQKASQGQQQRQAQELAQATADQQRALDALAQTNLAAAAQSQQAAQNRLKNADALPAVKALQNLANEAAKLAAENKEKAVPSRPDQTASLPSENSNDLARALQQAAADAAKAEQVLREALAKTLESNNPTNRTIEQSLDALDRKLRAELPKQQAALDAARSANAEIERNAQLGVAAEDQQRALEALEKGDVPTAEAAQRAADDHLAKGAATPSVKALQKIADEATRNAEGTPRDSEAMELAKAEQRVAAKALEQEKAIREAIARGEKTQADLDAFDQSFREQVKAKTNAQTAEAEKKLTPNQVKQAEGQKQGEAKSLAQAASDQKKAAEELAKGKPQNAAAAQRSAENNLNQGHATEGTKALQQAATKAAEAAAKSAAQRPDRTKSPSSEPALPTLENAAAAQQAAAEALDKERALREALKKGEASPADLDALDRANRAAANEAEKKLEAAKAGDKVADLATAAEAQTAAKKALDAVAASRAEAQKQRRKGEAASSPLDPKHQAALAEAMKQAAKSAKEAAEAQKQADDLLRRGEATEGVKAMQQLADKAAASSQKAPHDVARAQRAAAVQQAAAQALNDEKALREAMASGEKTAADLESFDQATQAAAKEQTAAFDRAEQAAAQSDQLAGRQLDAQTRDLGQAVAEQKRAVDALRNAAQKRAEEARARESNNQTAADARAREAQNYERQAAEAQRSAEDRLERNGATEGVKALQQLATTAARNARKAPQTKEKFELAQAAQKAATEALQNELKIREGIRKGEMTDDDLAALDDQLKEGLLKVAGERTEAAKAAAASAIRKAKNAVGTEEDDQLGKLSDAALEAARDAVSSQLSESKLRDDAAQSAALRDAEDALDAITADAADEQAVESRIRGLQQSAAEALSRNDRGRAMNLQKEIATAQARAADNVNEEEETAARAAANAAQEEAAEAIEKAYRNWNNDTKEQAIAAQKAAIEKELAAQSEAQSVRALSKLAAAEKAVAQSKGEAASPPLEENSTSTPPSLPAEAAEDASDALNREVNAQAAALGMSKHSAKPQKQDGEKSGGGGGDVSDEVKKLANDLKRNDSPDLLKSLFSRLGWFKIRGLSRDGLGTPDLKDVPPEYRDLVRRYFLKLSEENPSPNGL